VVRRGDFPQWWKVGMGMGMGMGMGKSKSKSLVYLISAHVIETSAAAISTAPPPFLPIPLSNPLQLQLRSFNSPSPLRLSEVSE